MRLSATAFALAIVTASATARADEAPAPAAPASSASSTGVVVPDEAPPPAPYAKGVVIDASVGAIGFLGQFRKLAPPGPWFHAQIGYEFFNWLMVFGEGELAFANTSNRDNPPNVRAFPMFGFGGGARFTWRITERVGIYGQPTIGMLKADTAKNTLGLHGFKDAEELGITLGFRAGFEWYQIDRHMALGLNTGIRMPMGFEKLGRSRDTPLALDGGVSLRYAF